MARRNSTFTTFLNIEEDKNVDKSFTALERKASNSFNRVAQMAAKASRAANGIGTGATGTDTAAIGAQLRQIQQLAQADRVRAQNLQQTTRAATTAAAAEQRLAGAHILESNAARAAAASTSNFERSLRLTSVAASAVQGPLGGVAGRLTAVANAVRDLTGIQFGLVGAAAAVTVFARYADSAQELKNQLRPLYDSQQQVNAAFMDARRIADDARVGMQPLISLYARLTLAGREAGLTQDRIRKVVDTAAKAARLSGGPAASQEAGLYQFAQGIGSGTLSGDELKSVKENTLRLAQAIASGWKNADGTIGTTIARLKELGAQGELTPERIADALERSSAKIEAELDKLPPTISSSLTKVNNAFLSMVNGTDEAAGATVTIARALDLLGGNLEAITQLIFTSATAWATYRSGTIVKGIMDRTAALRTERAQLAANAQATLSAANTAQSAATTARQAAASRVVALREERVALQAKVAADKAAADATRRTAIATGQNVQANYVTNNPREIGAYAAQLNAAKVAQDNYAASKAGLSRVTGELRTATGQLTTTTVGYRQAVVNTDAATKGAAAASAGWRGAIGGLLGAINPLGIALSIGVSLLIQWAFRQSEAADATRDMTNAQADLARFIDSTTGKIVEQNSQLVRNRALKTQDRLDDARRQGAEVRDRVRDLTQGVRLDPTGKLGGVPSNLPKNVQDAAAAYLKSGSDQNLKALQGALTNFSRTEKGRARVIDDALTALEENRKVQEQANAELAALQGKAVGKDATLGKAFGDGRTAPARTGAGAVNPKKTLAQLNAEAAAASARTELEKAEAEVKRIKSNATNIRAQGGDDDYVRQLSAATDQVDALRKAQTAQRASARAGAVQARKEARDALQDAKDLAASTRDNALLDLEKRRPTLSLAEYQVAGQQIIKTYDDTVNSLDASAAASNTATRKMISDMKALAAQSEKLGGRRDGILSGLTDAPKELVKAQKDIEVLRKMVGEVVDGIEFIGKSDFEIDAIKKTNPTGAGTYTAGMFNADATARIEAVRKPIQEILEASQQTAQVQGLRLQGYDTEANVLERLLDIQKQTGAVTRTDYENLLEQERVNERLNAQLERRGSLQQNILSLVDSTKTATQDLLTSFSADPKKALKNFGAQIQQNFLASGARDITERLFAGADRKLKQLINGSNGVDRAADILSQKVTKVGDAFAPLAAANDNLKSSADRAADALNAVATAAQGASGGGIPGLAKASNVITDASDLKEIVVEAQEKIKVDGGPIKTDSIGMSNSVKGFTKGLDDLFKSGSFFSGVGKTIQGALGGAATGSVTAGVMKMLGVKTSGTGAQIGGAIGSALPIPGGSIIGSIAGGLLGGLFKSNRTAGATVTGVDQVALGGKDNKNYGAAGGLAGSVSDQVQQIADALGATVGGFNVTIGTRGDEYRVNATGNTSLKGANGAVGFGDDAEAAVAYAVQKIVEQGALGGISKASQTILKSGQDLQKAIEKATVIESIPKRLKQLTDPVGYAVDELNTEFTKMISYLKEGGATAQQFADAQKLYDLERAQAIEQATKNTVSALQDYLNEMTAGAQSPLNKRTVYANAAEDLSTFRADIGAGKAVDQDKFLQAVTNFQNASRELNGSGGAFFADFNDLLGLVTKARDNAKASDSSGALPASPFDTTAVQQAIAGQTAATTSQTSTLTGKLDELIAAVEANGYTVTKGSMSNLPGFRNAA